jgi:20S proteasome alpha/beta subunit
MLIQGCTCGLHGKALCMSWEAKKRLDGCALNRKSLRLPYQPRKPYIRPVPRKAKNMTIAAGIRCSDGFVLCADSEITEGSAKSDRIKIWAEQDYLIATGSGTSDYVKMAFDKLCAILKNLPDDRDAAREAVEVLIYDIYDEHILPLSKAKHPLAGTLDLELIVAIRCKNADLALVKTTLTGAKLVEDFECTGAGSDVFRYWAKYFLPVKMSMELAGYLSLFMIREAKEVAAFVGGDTHIFKMAADPSKTNKKYTLWDDTEILAGFPKSTTDLVLACADTRMEDSDFESRIQAYMGRFRDFRQGLRRLIDDSRKQILMSTKTTSGTLQIPTTGDLD